MLTLLVLGALLIYGGLVVVPADTAPAWPVVQPVIAMACVCIGALMVVCALAGILAGGNDATRHT